MTPDLQSHDRITGGHMITLKAYFFGCACFFIAGFMMAWSIKL